MRWTPATGLRRGAAGGSGPSGSCSPRFRFLETGAELFLAEALNVCIVFYIQWVNTFLVNKLISVGKQPEISTVLADFLFVLRK